MSVDWNYYKTIMNTSSDTVDKQAVISQLQATMSEKLENVIDEYEVKKNMDYYKVNATLNFTTPIVVILKQEAYKEKVYNSLAKTVLCEPNTFNVGDYVTLNESGINETYIVRSRPIRKKTHDETFMLYCPYKLRILDNDGTTIHDYFLSFSDNKSRPGVNERADAGVTENSTFQAYVRHDAISRRLIENTATEQGKNNKISRILVDGLAYRIVGSDPASMEGLITLGLELTNREPSDNLELGIADYWNNVVEPTPEPTLEISGDSEVCIGETNTFNIATNNVVTWGLTNNGVNATLSLTGVNGECKVTAKNDTKLIGKTETLTAYLDYGATFTKTITITSLI